MPRRAHDNQFVCWTCHRVFCHRLCRYQGFHLYDTNHVETCKQWWKQHRLGINAGTKLSTAQLESLHGTTVRAVVLFELYKPMSVYKYKDDIRNSFSVWYGICVSMRIHFRFEYGAFSGVISCVIFWHELIRFKLILGKAKQLIISVVQSITRTRSTNLYHRWSCEAVAEEVSWGLEVYIQCWYVGDRVWCHYPQG